MKINFYFCWLGRNPNEVDADQRFSEWAHADVWFKFYKKCQKKYPDISFNAIDSQLIMDNKELYSSMTNGGRHDSGNAKYSLGSCLIENAENKKYFILAACDKLLDLQSGGNNWDLENCAEVFACQGGHLEDLRYTPAELSFKYTPTFFHVDYLSKADIIEKIYKQKTQRIFPDKLKFVGKIYLPRIIFNEDSRFEAVDGSQGNLHSMEDFIGDLNKYKVNLSLNAAGECSCRDVEIFGVGSVALRCELKHCKTHDPLIPDYHYAAVKFWDHADPQIKEMFLEKYEYLKKNPDLVEFIGNNARLWYEKNCNTESASNTLIEIVNFSKLI